jgi:hypothetical protein
MIPDFTPRTTRCAGIVAIQEGVDSLDLLVQSKQRVNAT